MIAAKQMLLLAVLTSIGVIEAASAKVVRWDLQNVAFNITNPGLPSEQSNATGFFLFDADAPADEKLISWDISLTNFLLPSYRFNSAAERGGILEYPGQDMYCSNSPGCLLFSSRTLLELDPIGRTGILLYLFPLSTLTDLGGQVPLDGFVRDTYAFGQPDEFLVTGELVAAPEVPQVLLLVAGLLSLQWIMNRRTRRLMCGAMRKA